MASGPLVVLIIPLLSSLHRFWESIWVCCFLILFIVFCFHVLCLFWALSVLISVPCLRFCSDIPQAWFSVYSFSSDILYLGVRLSKFLIDDCWRCHDLVILPRLPDDPGVLYLGFQSVLVLLKPWETFNLSRAELNAVAPIACRSRLQITHVSALSARYPPRLQSRRSIHQHHLVLPHGKILGMGLLYRLAHLSLMGIVACPSRFLPRHPTSGNRHPEFLGTHEVIRLLKKARVVITTVFLAQFPPLRL